ncbi:MAG: 50S ribosomal protein L24e [Candidatus Diapherotrites archaeon]|uniref:50S ribosomal protein L24e n=1 Tax=Candidatus Iainarchaeum sp. TaxID=3101447 RepID=A0A2D6M0K8_9ARCH|nr:50S ribosomal protein L24e [Candidatus Diapherotrites archaeon]|tara:strand:- start:3935 stop:4189 length:255 start_codon:yes stop_codon:yes gene_type:complete
MAKCSFCGKAMMKGSGTLFAKKDGTAYFFCSNKCQKNMLSLKRSPHATKWTEFHHDEKKAVKKTGRKPAKRAKRKGSKKKKKKR